MTRSEERRDIADWIGSTEIVDDVLTSRLANGLAAVLGRDRVYSDGEPVENTIHWCLAPAIAGTAALDSDGHVRRGGFLPPIALPRRMWAASRTTFHAPLRCGDAVRRHSVVRSIEAKEGRSGELCFVEVEHAYETARGLAVSETQTIVYRAADPSPPAGGAELAGPPVEAGGADPVTLFRYSALTFNSHRIHYDLAYAREVEGYPGLVVHGPLQASWLLEHVVRQTGMPRRFAFRGVAPLIAGRGFEIRSEAVGEEQHLAIVDSLGSTTLKAVAT